MAVQGRRARVKNLALSAQPNEWKLSTLELSGNKVSKKQPFHIGMTLLPSLSCMF